MKCPFCKGRGDLPLAFWERMRESDRKRRAVRALYVRGYSMRQIAKIFGYKTHATVQMYLRRK